MSFPALILTAVLLAACGDSNNLLGAASFENSTRTFSVYALTGTSSALPAAYNFTTELLARPQLLSNGGVNFDVAFDITSDNKVKLLPVRAVVPLPPAGAASVGMLKSASAYSALERAPDRGRQRLVLHPIHRRLEAGVVFEDVADVNHRHMRRRAGGGGRHRGGGSGGRRRTLRGLSVGRGGHREDCTENRCQLPLHG